MCPASSLPPACGCRPLRRQSCAVYSSAAPAPNVRRCWCGSPFAICACQRDFRSFVCISFQDSPRYGDLPVAKTNNPVSVQLFCDCGLSFVRAKYELAADQLICCAFGPRYALWRPAAIPNRKKVAIRGVFLFLGSLDRLERRSGMNIGPACEQGGPGGAVGAFGRALGGVPGAQCWALWGRACWPVSWSGTGPALRMRVWALCRVLRKRNAAQGDGIEMRVSL